MKTPILDRIGSDPEFMTGVYNEFEFQVVPAHKVISTNKQLTLNSFIGTDGHNSIGELRPRPCHNIRQHLYDIATALTIVDEHLKSRKDLKHVKIYASPELGGDTLAGHIHVSFFVDDPLTKEVIRIGRIQGLNGQLVNGYTCGLNAGPPGPALLEWVPILARYAEEAAAERLVTPLVMARSMAFLLEPLEWWLQPWHSRKRRNRNYGTGLDAVRWQQDGLNPFTRPKLVEHAWMHFEYRTPSTWLVHPWMAYTYLALAKITMVNWQLIQTLRKELLVLPVNHMSVEPQNLAASWIFMERWNRFKSQGGKITRDVSHIDRAIKICSDRPIEI